MLRLFPASGVAYRLRFSDGSHADAYACASIVPNCHMRNAALIEEIGDDPNRMSKEFALVLFLKVWRHQ